VLLAKSSGESLGTHTSWCFEAARALLASLPVSKEEKKELESEVLLAVALHDVGKAASGFQRLLRGEEKDWGGKRHEVLSAALASSLSGVPTAVLFAILTHHKSLPSDGISALGSGCLLMEQIPLRSYVTPVWEEMVREWEENRGAFEQEWRAICGAVGREDLVVANWRFGEIALDSAWLNRTGGRRGQRKAIPFPQRWRASVVRGLTMAADHLGSAHRLPSPVPDLNRFRVLRHPVRPFQEATGSTEGSAILRAPTGSGKTEAALLWVQRNQCTNGRVFYVLPYTASINAMYLRLGPGRPPNQVGVFGAENVGILHSRASAALYSMLEADEDYRSRLDRQERARALGDLARELWFPVRVCTPHQILRYMLRGKGWEAMLAEFPNSCLVFDEVHAYDPRVVGLTLGAARVVGGWGARCLFLSATLPKFLERLIRQVLGEIPVIVPNEACARDREILDRKRHYLTTREGDLRSNLGEIVKGVGGGGSTLVVCNHVRTAQEVFGQLKAAIGDVVLLHSRFNQVDRNRIELLLSGNSLPKVLVSTQVIEVSLDIDFDRAFLEPAPIDALVQRMGRVNRAGKRDKAAEVVLFTGQVSQHHLYCKCDGGVHQTACRVGRSIERLRHIRNPVSEKDLVDAADEVYSDGYRQDERVRFEEGLNHPDIVDFEARLLAGAHQDWAEQVIESTDGTFEVLPRCLLKEYEVKCQQGLWIEANALMVPVREKSLSAVRGRLDSSGDPWIVNCPYSSTTGLDL